MKIYNKSLFHQDFNVKRCLSRKLKIVNSGRCQRIYFIRRHRRAIGYDNIIIY